MLNAKSSSRTESQLRVSGGAISVTCDWITCAVLRDNVQHHLEGGKPSGRYPAVHGLADAVWNGEGTLEASVLSAELDNAWPVLSVLPISKLAVGIRSRAALTRTAQPPVVRGTVLLRLAGWSLPLPLSRHKTLGDLLGPTYEKLLQACGGARTLSYVLLAGV